MKPVVLFLTVLGCVVANPNGYYHQEYNYKTSSSSYKNNELQHQTDDQGYYRKDGDLSGKVRPRVDANSEHSEYVNPNLRNSDYNTGLVGNANGDLSSYGHMRANVGSYGSHDLSSEGLARAERLVGTKSGGAYSGYSSGSYGTNSYGTQSYGTSSNLRSITSSIQQDLERELQRAIQEQRAYSQSGVGVSELERELRMNLTNKLNSELANRYGQQSIRGGLSYTISGGRLHSTANYDNQELQDLRTQIENNLLNQLRTQYYQTSSHYENRQSSQNNYGYSTTVRPVYYYQQPYRPATTVRPYGVYVPSSQIRYTPVSNPESLTTIASRVQNQLDSRLNELLDDVQRRYFSSSSSYSLTNYNVVLENLRNELKNNITYLLNENVKSNYGNQIPKDGHMYSISSDGQTSTQQNYAISDLENLRSQIERNLIEKLNRDFETYRSRWYQQQSSHSQASQSSSNIRYGSYSTPRYDTYSTPHYNSYDSDVEHFSTRPSSTHIVPLISSGGSSSSNGRHYNLLAGTSQSGYEISSGSGGRSLSELQSRLQQDLSRQLQSAISRGQYGSYSSSGSYTAPTYQSSLQELSNELNRNLTKQLQEYSASGSYSSYGNFDQTQLANLRNQLQENLMRQLQQGLQQSFQSSSSFSSSSSSSSNGNYRPARGFDNYQSGQYRSGENVLTMNGADCVGDDPNAYNSHRMKRSYPPYRTRPLGLGYSSNAGYNSNYGYRGGYSQQQELGQQVDESDLTQQVEDVSLEKLQQGSLSQQVDLDQQVDDSQLTQQVEDSGFGKLQLDSQNQQQINAGQQIDDSDLIQVEDKNYGKVQLDSHSQIGYGQQTDDSELTQQVQTENLGQLQPGSQNQRYVGYGQQDDDSELTQQVENEDFGQLQLASQNQQGGYSPQIENLDLTQQVEDENFGKLQAGAQNQQVDQSSQLQDLTQQIEDSNIGKLQVGSQAQQQVHLDQEPHSAHQVQSIGLGKLQLGSQGQQQGQQEDNSDLTQQVEDFHGQQLVQQREDIGNSDLTQQVEEVNFGGEPGQVDNSDLIEQVGGTGLGKLQQNYQNQQPIRYGTQNSNLNRGDINISQNQHGLSQQEDNSDLTQQVQNHFTDDIQPGSVQNSQQGEDFGQFTSHAHINLGHHQTNDNNRLQFNFNPKQRQAALELGNELSKQLKDAVRSYYTGSYSHLNSHQSTYQDLVKELERNLTRQLQAVGPSSGNTRYTYSFVFSGPQRDLLKQQLENELKLQLQREISFASGSTNLGQHQIDQELSNNDLNQNIDSQSQTQQNINSELTQQQQNGLGDVEFGGQTQDLTQQIGYDQINQQGGFEQGQLVDNNNRGHQTNDNRLGFNINQKQAALELGNELSRQLKDAVRSHYTGSSSQLSSYQTTYQDLVKELERNLTQQLQAVGPSSGNTRYTYSFVFSGPQRDLLKQQLETKLKLQLQREISFASGSTNLGQHQINQELSNNDLNQNIDSQSQTQQNINSELTQQQQNGLENIESGGQTQDLTQQIGYDQINQQSEFGQGQLVDNHNSGRLQFGTQHIEQQSVNNQNDLTQQIDINHPGNSQLTGHQIGTQSTDQLHNPLLSTQFASSGRLQFGRRPVNQKPTDSTNFINTEVNQQQQLYPNQNIVSHQNNNKPNNLQTLNQVITQQGDNGEAITDSELIDNQQQQENTDLSFQNENYASHIPTGLAHNSVGQSTLGQGFATNKPPSYAQILRQGNSGYTSSGSATFQTGQQTNPLNQHHDDSFHTYLNNQQVELAYQLKNELSRQLQDAIAQNNYALSQSNLRGEIRGQFLSELQRNITKQLEQIFNGDGYSTYSSYSHSILTPEQKDKLLRQLSADLSGQLQQNIQVTYDQQNNGHNSFHTGIIHSSSAGANSALGSGSGGLYSGHGSNVNKYDTQDTANQLNYGQQEVVDSETVSALHPLQPEQATAVQNVEPQSNYHNTGIKRPGRVFTPTLPPSPIVEPEVQSQSELITPSNINTGSVPQEVAGLNETQDENVPWWKRVGNKIRQGATNLKEKIIG